MIGLTGAWLSWFICFLVYHVSFRSHFQDALSAAKNRLQVFSGGRLWGLDIWEKVLANLLPHLNNNSEVPLIVREKVKQKPLRLRSGKGFYSYGPADASEQLKDRERKLKKLLRIKRRDE